MINLQPGVSAQEHSGLFFVLASLSKLNELHDALSFHFCPFVSQFNFPLSIAFLYRTSFHSPVGTETMNTRMTLLTA